MGLVRRAPKLWLRRRVMHIATQMYLGGVSTCLLDFVVVARTKGFTLIELQIICLIIGILAAITIPGLPTVKEGR